MIELNRIYYHRTVLSNHKFQNPISIIPDKKCIFKSNTFNDENDGIKPTGKVWKKFKKDIKSQSLKNPFGMAK